MVGLQLSREDSGILCGTAPEAHALALQPVGMTTRPTQERASAQNLRD